MDTGWLAPSGADDNDWSNGVNILSSNNQYATCSIHWGQMDAYWDDLGIPWDAVIDGIEVKIEWSSQSAGQAKISFNLYHSDYDSQDGHYYDEIESEVTYLSTTGTTDIVSDLGNSTYLFNPDIRTVWRGEDFQNLLMNIWDENGAAYPRIDQVLIKVWWHQARVMNDYILRGASRTTTADRIKIGVRSLIDNILYGAQRFPTTGHTFYRTMADSVMHGASRFVALTRTGGIFVRGLVDNIFLLKNITDKYDEANANTTLQVGGTWWTYAGQSFANPGAGVINSIKLLLSTYGTISGTLTVKIYAHTGTFGSSGTPTGSALATSDAIDVNTLTTTSQLIRFYFTGSNRITLAASTNYCIVLDASNITASGSNYVKLGMDTTSPTHAGNAFYKTVASSWQIQATYDIPFYIYTSFNWAFGKVPQIFIRAMADYIINGVQPFTKTYALSNGNAGWPIYTGSAYGVAGGQTFMTPAGGKSILDSCQFGIEKIGDVTIPTGNIYAKLYAHTGTFGSTGNATGSALATSDPIDITTVCNSPNPVMVTFKFSGVNRVMVNANTPYVIMFFYSGGDATYHPILMIDSTSPTDPGNFVYSLNGTSFGYSASYDTSFSVSFVGRLGAVAWVKIFVRTMADSIIRGASRVISLARTGGIFTRAMTDNILIGASRISSFSRIGKFIRNSMVNIMVAAYGIPTMGRGYVRAMTDDILRGASRMAGVSRDALNYIRALSDSISITGTPTNITHYFRTLSDSLYTTLVNLFYGVMQIKPVSVVIKEIRTRVLKTKNIKSAIKLKEITPDTGIEKINLNIKTETKSPTIKIKSANPNINTKSISPDIKNKKPIC